jgi:hypothetical protein
LVLKPPNLPKTAENLTLHIATEFQKQENISDNTAQFQYRIIPSGRNRTKYIVSSSKKAVKKEGKISLSFSLDKKSANIV